MRRVGVSSSRSNDARRATPIVDKAQPPVTQQVLETAEIDHEQVVFFRDRPLGYRCPLGAPVQEAEVKQFLNDFASALARPSQGDDPTIALNAAFYDLVERFDRRAG